MPAFFFFAFFFLAATKKIHLEIQPKELKMANENVLFFSDQNENPIKNSVGQNRLWGFFSPLGCVF